VKRLSFEVIAQTPPGRQRSAAIVEWFQGLYETEGQEAPVLVGGGAVELYTGGAYTTEDLDFVGSVPGPGVERELREAGFERHGRHWIHEEAEIFLELPASALDEGSRVDEVEVEGHRLKVLAPEAVLVDRLAAWVHWRSSLDGVAAFLLYRELGPGLDQEALHSLAVRDEVLEGLDRLERFVEKLGKSEPSAAEVEQWALEIPQ